MRDNFKNTSLFIVFILLVLLSITATYYEFVVLKSFTIVDDLETNQDI